MMLKKRLMTFFKKMEKADFRFLKAMLCIFLSLLIHTFVGPYLIVISEWVSWLGLLLIFSIIYYILFSNNDFSDEKYLDKKDEVSDP